MVFPNSDYDTTAFSESGDDLIFTRSAFGAEKLRYSVDFWKNWAPWRDWVGTTASSSWTSIDKAFF